MKKAPRKCGECRECCIALEITELKKPAGTPCHNLCAKGCSIYGNHPAECRQFRCLWLDGMLPSWMKPNKTHAVPWVASIQAPGGRAPVQVLRVSFNGMFKRSKRVLRWAKAVSRKQLVVLAHRGEMNEALVDGESAGMWKTGEATNVKVDHGRIVAIERTA